MYNVDLNSDLGESYGRYILGFDEEIIKSVTSANLACGLHAGDPLVMNDRVILAKENNVAIGAHPGFPDLQGFGRRFMKLTPEEVKSYVKYQIGALMAFTKSNGVKMQHVKAHGALGNAAAVNKEYSRAICEAVYEINPNIIMLSLATSEMKAICKEMGLRVASEVFADREYMDDGTLTPRSMPGSVIMDEDYAIERVITMIKEHKVKTITGKTIEIDADSVCIHGDSEMAVNFSRKILAELKRENINICNLSEMFN